MGIGDWGLGIVGWVIGAIPNAQSPTPQSPIPMRKNKFFISRKIKFILNFQIKNNYISN